MSTVASDALSDAARRFVDSGPHKLLIGADWVEAADGRTFETVDPSTGTVICEVAQAGAEDVERAAKAARAALEGEWGKMPAAAAPFGGYKASGIGREMGHANLDAYLEVKTSLK